MKKKKYLLALTGLAGLAAVTLSGCKKITAVSLLTDTAKNVTKIESFKGTMDMNMEMGVAQNGISMGLNVNMAMDMEATQDPTVYHMDGELGMDLLNLSVALEAYGETNGNETTVYMNVGDEWQKQVVDADNGENMNEILNLDSFLADDIELTLAEKTEKENGKEVYVISTVLDGDIFNNSMEGFAGLMDEDMMESIDFSDLVMDVTLKIYKDSRLPAVISMTMDENSAAVFEEDGVEMSLTELSYEINIQEYNTVDTIEIPKEAMDAPEASEGTAGLLEESAETLEDDLDDTYTYEIVQDEDGNYLLTDYSQSVQVPIAAPKGFTLSDYADCTYLCFDSTDDNDDIYAELYYGLTELSEYYTEEDLLDYFSSRQDFYTEDDEYFDVVYEDVQTMKVGSHEVNYASISYRCGEYSWEKDYYAWTVLENNYAVECNLSETAYEEGLSIIDESTIKAAFEALK